MSTLNINNDYIHLNSASSDKVVVEGSLGIGTTSPGAKLQINGATADGTANALIVRNSSLTSLFSIRNDGRVDIAAGALVQSGGGYANTSSNSSYFTGNVGIGTTSPAYPLDIVGFANSSSGFRVTDGTIDNRVSWSSGNVGFFGTASNHPIAFNTNLTERMRITSAGNVGIGTTSPGQKLHVAGAIYSTAFVYGEAHLAFTEFRVRNNENYRLGKNGTDFRLNSVNDITFSTTTSYTERMRITSSGDVGIGTTSPSAALHVQKDVSGGFAGYLYNTQSTGGFGLSVRGGNSSSEDALRVQNVGGTYLLNVKGDGNVGIGTTAPAALLTVSNTVDNGAAVRVQRTNTLSGSYTELGTVGGSGRIESFNGNLTVGADASNTDSSSVIQFKVDNSEKARITSAGNVGIGTISPGSKLHSKGEIRVDYNDTDGSTYVTGFGVEFQRSSNYLRPRGADGTQALYLGAADDSLDWNNINFKTSSHSQFRVAGSDVMRINSTGVGIGTTSPAYKLDVAGDIRSSQRLWLSSIDAVSISGTDLRVGYSNDNLLLRAGSAERMRITSSGKVGIGTTSPTARLNIGANTVVQSTNGIALGVGQANLEFVHSDYQSGFGSKFYSVDSGSGVTSLRLAVRYNSTAWVDAMTVIAGTGNGNVGIGTTSPQKAFEAISGGNNFVSVGVQQLGVGQWAGVHFGYRESNASYRKSAIVFERTDLTSNNAQGKIHILNGPQNGSGSATLADAKLTIAENGNVGIGTSTPGNLLHIQSASSGFSGTYDSRYKSIVEANGEAYYATYVPDNSFSGIRFNSTSGLRGYIDYYHGTQGDALVYSALNHHKFLTNGVERVRLIQNGNVGIGTASPSYKLDVSGTARAVKSKIDITPTSDTIALDIRGTGTPNDYFTVSNATGGANDVFLPIFFYKAATYGYNGGTNRYPSGVYGGGFVAAVDDTSYPSAAGAGAAMHFNARTYANNGPLTNRYLFSWGSWLTTHMAMTAGGNLLIGKTTDSGEELQVNGDADVSGDINADGDFYHNGTQGYTGNVTIQQPSPNPPITLEINGGIITNVT